MIDLTAASPEATSSLMGTSRLTRRRLIAGATLGAAQSSAIVATPSQAEWSALLCQLEAAEADHQHALEALGRAEKRFFALPKRLRNKAVPEWYVAACYAEAQAGDAKETLYFKVAAMPAAMRLGQIAKIRLLAHAYGVRLDHSSNGEDLVAQLIRSLAVDLTTPRVS